MANIRKKNLTESNNNKQSSIDPTQTNVEKQKESENINKLADVPTPPKELQNTKSNLTVKDLPTSKILDENGTEIRVYQNLGDINYKTAEYRYKVISIAQNNILPPDKFKDKFLYYKNNYNKFIRDIHAYNDSIDNSETKKIIDKYNHIQTVKVDKKSYLGLQNDLICDFISYVFEPTILLKTKKEIVKHIKSYTAKAKALDWGILATKTRLTMDKEKYYNSVKNLQKTITDTIHDHWDKANYKPRWKAVIFNYKNPPNRLEKIRLEKRTLDLFYFKWWAKKTDLGKNNIPQRQMSVELEISLLTANNIIKKIKKEQSETVKTKGDNTKEKVKNWFLKNGNYRGANNDCSKQLNIDIRHIENIKIKFKKEGVTFPKIKKK